LALAGERPEEVTARGEAFLRRGVEDVVFGYLHFPSGLVAHLHVSWLDPHKRRMITVVGSEGMAVFDDTETDRKLTIYERASSPSRFDTWGEFQALRSGDVRIPQVSNAEPLLQETKAFAAAIRRGSATIASGDEGLAVVEVLTALQTSLEQRGAPIRLDGQ
jgi:predicted dehydrogenase